MHGKTKIWPKTMTEPSLDLDEGSKFYYYKNLFTGKVALVVYFGI